MGSALSRRPGFWTAIVLAIIVVAGIAWFRSGRHVSPPVAVAPSPLASPTPVAKAKPPRARLTLVEGCVSISGRCVAAKRGIANGDRLVVEKEGLALLQLDSGGEVAIYGDSELSVSPFGVLLARGTIRVRGLAAQAEVALDAASRVRCEKDGCGFHVVRGPGKDEVWGHRGKVRWETAQQPIQIAERELVKLGKVERSSSPREIPDAAVPILWIDEQGGSITLSRPKEVEEKPIVVEVSRDRSFENADRGPPEEGADLVTLPNLRDTGVHYVRFLSGGEIYPDFAVLVIRNSPPVPSVPEQAGKAVLGKVVDFAWKDPTSSKAFDVEVASDAEFKTPVKKLRVSEKSEVKLSLPKTVGQYFWRVRSADTSRPKQPWSDVWVFNLVEKEVPPLIAPPVILSAPEFDPDLPEILEVSSDGSLQISWKPVEGAHSYVITIFDDQKQLLYSKKVAGALANSTLKGIPTDRHFNVKGVTLRMATINTVGKRGEAGLVKALIYRPPTAGAGPKLNSIQVQD